MILSQGEAFGKEILQDTRKYHGISVTYTLYQSKGMLTRKKYFSFKVETYSGGSKDISVAYDVAQSLAHAMEIFDLLRDNFVTSCTLTDILEDIL